MRGAVLCLLLALSAHAQCFTNRAPLNPAMASAVPIAFTMFPGLIEVSWQAYPGHQYDVEYCTNLAGPWWTLAFYNLGTNGGNITQSCPILACEPNRFFRVRSN